MCVPVHASHRMEVREGEGECKERQTFASDEESTEKNRQINRTQQFPRTARMEHAGGTSWLSQANVCTRPMCERERNTGERARACVWNWPVYDEIRSGMHMYWQNIFQIVRTMHTLIGAEFMRSYLHTNYDYFDPIRCTDCTSVLFAHSVACVLQHFAQNNCRKIDRRDMCTQIVFFPLR